jgi:phytoene synthase
MDTLVAHGRTTIAAGSRSFATAARVFPPAVRDDAYLLYAWCRYCDDAVDGQVLGHGRTGMAPCERTARLDSLFARTHRALAGEATPGDTPFEGLRRVAQHRAIPARYPLELLEGFAKDVRGERYDDPADTLTYCYHVAGTVGVMMAIVMGTHDEAALDRACDLGIALQLTNIARDLVEDAEAGRVYVPAAWLREIGVGPAELAHPARRAHAARLATRLLDLAEPYYESARAGLPYLSLRSAWAVDAARRIYRDIGVLTRERGARAWDDRAVVGRGRKWGQLVRALGTAVLARQPMRQPPGREGLWTRARLSPG